VTYLLDACSLIAFFRKEPGGEVLFDLLLDSKARFVIHALNVCEVYYDFFRADGETAAKLVVQIMLELGIEIREDMDPALWKSAGKLKATLKKISLADSFAVALAARMKATLLTSDHAEFDAVAEKKLAKIRFIR